MVNQSPAHLRLSLLLLFACSICLSSCAFLLGVKDQKSETVNGLHRYYRKMGIDTALVIFIKPHYLDTLKMGSFKSMDPGFRPLQFRLFGPDGNIVSHWASCEGTLRKTGLLETFPPVNLTPMDSSLTLAEELKMVDNTAKTISPKPGYSMFIYSQKWLGKLDKIITKKILVYGQEHDIANIYVFNMDMR